MAGADLDFAQIWQNTSRPWTRTASPAQQRAFLSLARLAGLLDGTALVKVPNDFTKEVVETRVRDQVTRALSSQLGMDVRLAVTVDSSLDLDHAEPKTAARAARARTRHRGRATPPTRGSSDTPGRRPTSPAAAPSAPETAPRRRTERPRPPG